MAILRCEKCDSLWIKGCKVNQRAFWCESCKRPQDKGSGWIIASDLSYTYSRDVDERIKKYLAKEKVSKNYS